MIGYPEFATDIQKTFKYLIDEYHMEKYEANEDEISWMCVYQNEKLQVVFSINHPWNNLNMEIVLKSIGQDILKWLDLYLDVQEEKVIELAKELIPEGSKTSLREQINREMKFYNALLLRYYSSILSKEFDWFSFEKFVSTRINSN